MTRLAPGMVVDGRYRVERLIGSGGMADVWMAADLDLQRRVALKVLREPFSSDPQFTERFRREAEAAAGLQQVNIVPILDRGQTGDTLYIAMGLIQGRTLSELIPLDLTPQESISIVRQVLEAAGYAHQHGVIHRDLKPANVMVDDTGMVTVTDFGIARAGRGGITDEGAVMGTIKYLSPEQAQGMDASPLSDLYSVGVMLYECLTGRVPFDGDTPAAVVLQQMQQQPLPPSAWNPAVSPELDAIVLKALSREPYDRFPDAESFIEALDRVQSAPPTMAPEPGSPWPWAVGAVVAVLLLLALIGLVRPNSVVVPDVTGQQLDDAVAQLDRNNFKLGDLDRVERPGRADRVLAQDPQGKTSRDCAFLGWFCSNPQVNLRVSAGPGKVEVPDVIGMTRSEAVTTLKQSGLGAEVETRASESVPENEVIETEPAAGQQVARGSSVLLAVSSGPAKVKVPDVVGMTLNAARQQLEAIGLEVKVAREYNEKPRGQVLAQSPGADSEIAVGRTVSLVVSRGPQEQSVTVPDVVGMSRADAVSALELAGFQVQTNLQLVTSSSQNGIVLSQVPAGNASQDKGGTVTITVGTYSTPDSGNSGSGGSQGGVQAP